MVLFCVVLLRMRVRRTLTSTRGQRAGEFSECVGDKERTASGMALREGIIQLLDKAQTSTVHHAKLVKTLQGERAVGVL